MAKVKNVLAIQAQLGECPVWSTKEHVLYFVDIVSHKIHRFCPKNQQLTTITVEEEIGCIGLREQGGFIAGMRTGIYLLDQYGHIEKKLADNPTAPNQSRFNDGRVDPMGRFWCGTLWQPRDKNAGKLCCVDLDLSCSIKAENIMVSNGLAFSPDHRYMYHSDTSNYVLYRYPYSPDTGNIGSREVIKHFPRGKGGRPDGAAMDSEGFYWSAMYDGGRIIRLHPHTYEIVQEIKIPTRWPTMVAFGGENLTTLYITSAREHRTAEELFHYPQSGDLLAIDISVAGLAEPYFQG